MVSKMTLEQLMAMGLTKEQAEKVMESLNGNFVTKTRFNEVNTELKQSKDTLKERDSQLEELKKSTGDVEALNKKITELQEENKTKDETHAAELKKLKREAIDESILSESKAKNTKAVRALLDDIDGSLDDEAYKLLRAEQIKKLVEAEDTKFLFETEKKPSFKGAKPGETGKEGPDGAVDLKNMSYDELCAYLEENPDAKI
jgi:TolA-binding protein